MCIRDRLPPGKINGTDESWVYTGCFESESEAKQEELLNLLVMPGGKRWLLDRGNLCLRTFFEGSYGDKYWVSQGGSAFGRWDYPLGVTLFGLLRTCLLYTSQDDQYDGRWDCS